MATLRTKSIRPDQNQMRPAQTSSSQIQVQVN